MRRVRSHFSGPHLVLLVCCVLLRAEQASAQEDRWVFIGGPPHGPVIELEVAPSNRKVLYAGDAYGRVFSSRNGGDSWTGFFVEGDSLQRPILDLAVHPTDADIVYCIVDTWIYRSLDGGRSWQQRPGNSHKLAVSPTHPDRVYSDMGRSDDAGLSWRGVPLPPVPSNRRVPRALAVSPGDEPVLFWSSRSKVYRSLDLGQSWEETMPRAANDIAFRPGEPPVTYAATTDAGVYTSLDLGATWSISVRGLTYQANGKPRAPEVLAVVPHPQRLDEVYAGVSGKGQGVFRSTNRGASWRRFQEIAWPGARRLVHLGGERLMLSSGSGRTGSGPIYRSQDGGVNWALSGVGIGWGRVFGYGRSQAHPLVVVGRNGTGQTGQYWSSDRGLSWRPMDELGSSFEFFEEGYEEGERRGIVHHPTDDSVRFARTHLTVEISVDAGRYWEPVSRRFGFQGEPELLFLDPDDSQQLYLGTSHGFYRYRFSRRLRSVPPQPTASFATLPKRGTWTHYFPGQVQYALARHGKRVWALGSQLRAVEEGQAEIFSNGALPRRFPRGTNYQAALAVDAEGRVWVSSNLSRFDGQIWEAMAPELVGRLNYQGEYYALASLLLLSDGRVWAGSQEYGQGLVNGGLFELQGTDGVKQRPSVPDPFNINVLAEGPDGVLWVGSGSVVRGTDPPAGGLSSWDGTSWRTFDVREGLAHPYVRDIVFAPNGELWLATDGGLTRFDGEFGRSYTPANSALGHSRVLAVAVDSLGVVWAGTAAGLTRFDGSHWTNYVPADGLTGPQVRDVLIDSRGQVWAATSSGLSVLDYGARSTALGETAVGLPPSFALGAAFPNPFNGGTAITYQLPRAGRAELVLYNAVGQPVRRLVDGVQAAGSHRVVWDGTAAGRRLGSGVYFYRLRAAGSQASRPLVLLE
ncbi:MAG: T9SS type A sorting domain-containing protein [Candidatus Latescibacteria bacterium]|nr:T9SS type A sorting domain-containing protein [Candidatus Latescibacterota bacterium]